MDKEKLLHALIIEDSANDAELLANLLRNAGYAVRAVGAETEEELRRVLQEHNLDVALCSMDSSEPTLEQTHQAIIETGRDIALLATTGTGADLDSQTRAMQMGALDLFDRDNPERLQLVMDREIRNLEARRELRRCEIIMRESEKRCHALLDSSRDAITYVHEGMHVYANPVYLENFGYTDLEEIEGMPVMDMVAPEDHGKFKEFLRRHNKNQKEAMELEVMGLRADSSTFNAVMEFSPASIDGEPCTQIIIRNQALSKELENKLKNLSKQDLLTGLYNRQFFLEELERSISEAAADTIGSAVLYIQPDNFKAIKETVGIAGGDLVLSDIANLLRAELDENSVAARFGDNTFTILLRGQDRQAAEATAERIRSAIENHIAEVGDNSVTTTCSIGIGLVGETSQSAQEVLSRADVACEVAGKDGGNRIHLHNPVADEKAGLERDQHWLQLIREALKQDRFKLVYQPIASLHGETSERYEVLVRMRDSDGNDVLPGQFMPAAEKHGLIGGIDRWVIGRAIQVLAERRRAGRDTTFFVKVSGATLDDATLLPWVSEQLTKNRLEGDSLVFELSESAAVTNLKSARQFVKGLQQLRCRFSLDHFGNGTHSFQLLKHLPADFLKIDGSFMRNLATDQEQQEQVKNITDMAHSMGKTTIAEFVEDASSLAVLWQCGVNYIQGHFLQAPNEAMEFDFQGEET